LLYQLLQQYSTAFPNSPPAAPAPTSAPAADMFSVVYP
jgi:hypothetical protein